MNCLWLHGNQLTGESILCSSRPVWYTSKPSAEKRSIKYSTGRIPTELLRCSAMKVLSLSGNQLTGTSILCSSCPVWYTSIPSADNRSINYFTGRIPTELGRCSAMSELNLRVNKLTGTHFCAHSSQLVHEYTILQPSEFFYAGVLCAKKRVGACTVRSVAHRALRLRLRRTGQDAFKTFMKQKVPCSVYL